MSHKYEVPHRHKNVHFNMDSDHYVPLLFGASSPDANRN